MSSPSVTTGVDLAASPRRTAACVVRWDADRVFVARVEPAVDDDAFGSLLDDLPPGGKLGLDCPLGWPAAFVSALRAHQERAPWPLRGSAGRSELLWRATDRWLGERCRRWPLSVSTDRIGVTALRAAYLLDRWEASGAGRVDRAGLTGPVVEVYPAAARRVWGLGATRSVEELEAKLNVQFADSGTRRTCESNEHAFDALVAAFVARAAALFRTHRPPAELAAVAAVEGWIHLPACSLEDLTDAV